MKTSTNKETAAYLHDFTVREERLLERAREKQLELPERLSNWRLWIADPQLYLNELRNFVETTK